MRVERKEAGHLFIYLENKPAKRDSEEPAALRLVSEKMVRMVRSTDGTVIN